MKLETWQAIRAKKFSADQLKEIDEEVERELAHQAAPALTIPRRRATK